VKVCRKEKRKVKVRDKLQDNETWRRGLEQVCNLLGKQHSTQHCLLRRLVLHFCVHSISAMPEPVVTATKRKNPPKFQHHPKNRGMYVAIFSMLCIYSLGFCIAIALKKAWVEKTKIKSKWKAQKRKEDLASQSKLEIPTYSDGEDKLGLNHTEGAEVETERPTTTPEDEPQKAHLHPSRAHIHPGLPVKRTKTSVSKSELETETDARAWKKRKVSSSEEEPQVVAKPSLRDLEKEAYSKSTLHTYKSDPFKKLSASGRGGRSGYTARRPETGRGQPNMKLRMNAMLERIKQNYT